MAPGFSDAFSKRLLEVSGAPQDANADRANGVGLKDDALASALREVRFMLATLFALLLLILALFGGHLLHAGHCKCEAPSFGEVARLASTPVWVARTPVAESFREGNLGCNVLVVYVGKESRTLILGNAVAEGAESAADGVQVRVLDASEATFADVLWADAVVLGSPTYNAAVHPDLQTFINSWPFDGRARDKVGGTFVTSGGVTAGHELVLASLHASMQIFGFIVAAGPTWVTALGAYDISEEQGVGVGGLNGKYFTAEGRRYGASIARLASQLRGVTRREL